jgi:hypothetical protein
MRLAKLLQLSILAALLGAVLAAATHADEWNKKTYITTNDQIQIPGYVLDPGTYVFKLANSSSDRHIVQVWTGDERQLITTIVAIPAYRRHVTDDTVLRFDESSGDEPAALRVWFYPGDNYGQEFVYPYTPMYNESSANLGPR